MKSSFASISALTAACLVVPAVGLAACSDPSAPESTPPSVGPSRADASDDAPALPPRPPVVGDAVLTPNAPAKVTECARAPLMPAASGTCEVTQAGTAGGGRIFRGTVLAPDEVLRRGEVLVSVGGAIVCAACDCSASAGYAAATVVTCANGVISPGLINPHDHITFANNAPVGHGTERFEHRHDWRLGARGHKKVVYKSGASKDVVRFAELRFVMSGVTAIAGAGGEKGLVRNMDDVDLDLLEGLPTLTANSDTFPLGDTSGKMLATGCEYGSGTSSAEVRTYEGYLPHIAEGIDEQAHNEIACTSVDDRAARKSALIQRQTAIIHSVAATASDAETYRRAQASVVWSPRSNVDLYGNTAPVTLLDAVGVPIALGTDWVPSGSMNMLRELRCADDLNTNYYGKHFADADLWRMVTINAAFAVGAQNVIGSLRAGYVADIAIFAATPTASDHRAVIDAGVEDVALVLRGGTPLYGDAALLDHAAMGGAACEALDVGGAAKKACIAQDIGGGTTLATVRAAGEAIYPLFFAKGSTPTGEPSCVPYRETYKAGRSDADTDGDGIANDADLCPTIFDPVRPLDGKFQADSDQDGVGDACDRCPLDAMNACTRPQANDVDGDGVTDGSDNCPELANETQGDGDGDGRGDACDTCPVANPGATACPLAIRTLRDGSSPEHPRQGAIVSIDGAYVTARSPSPFTGSSRGLYVQAHDPASPAPQPYSGIFLFTGSATATEIGNADVGARVSATGVYREYFGVSQVVVLKSNLQATPPASRGVLPFAPIVVTAAEIRTGGSKASGYESMLLEVNTPGMAVTNENPDAPRYYYEFSITGDLRIGSGIFTRFGKPATPNPPTALPFANGTPITRVIGIGAYSFGNAKLWPRSAADIISP